VLKIKDDTVQIQGLRPEMLFALQVAAGVYAAHGQDCVVTSLNDGKHSITSLHYAGCAADLRTRVFASDTEAKQVTEEIRSALNVDYDLVFENDHIHLEYQPRRRG
jgi:hypothetical protein